MQRCGYSCMCVCMIGVQNDGQHLSPNALLQYAIDICPDFVLQTK